MRAQNTSYQYLEDPLTQKSKEQHNQIIILNDDGHDTTTTQLQESKQIRIRKNIVWDGKEKLDREKL